MNQPKTETKTAPAQQHVDPLERIIDETVFRMDAAKFVPLGETSSIILTAQDVLNMLVKPTKSGHLPTMADAIKFVRLCEARKLNPFVGDAFIVGYDSQEGPVFNLITAHQAFLKRANRDPDFNGFESGTLVLTTDPQREGRQILAESQGDIVLPGETLFGAWCTVHFKSGKIPVSKRIMIKAFAKGISRWNVDPAGMIVKCAEADALRTACPQDLAGLYTSEELSGEHVATTDAFPMPKPIAPTPVEEPSKPVAKPAPAPEQTPPKPDLFAEAMKAIIAATSAEQLNACLEHSKKLGDSLTKEEKGLLWQALKSKGQQLNLVLDDNKTFSAKPPSRGQAIEEWINRKDKDGADEKLWAPGHLASEVLEALTAANIPHKPEEWTADDEKNIRAFVDSLFAYYRTPADKRDKPAE